MISRGASEMSGGGAARRGASEHISRLKAEVAILERQLESERSARAEAAGLLTLERVRNGRLSVTLKKLEARQPEDPNPKLMAELESAWTQLNALRKNAARPRRWWRR